MENKDELIKEIFASGMIKGISSKYDNGLLTINVKVCGRYFDVLEIQKKILEFSKDKNYILELTTIFRDK